MAAEPVGAKGLDFLPGQKRHGRGQRRRQRRGLVDLDAPCGQPLVLVPVEIIDQGIAGLPLDRDAPFQRAAGAGDRGVERGEFRASGSSSASSKSSSSLAWSLSPALSRSLAPPLASLRRRSRHAGRTSRPDKAQPGSPARSAAGDQRAMRPHRRHAGRAGIHARVMQHQVFEMGEIALEPDAGAGVAEVAAGQPSLADAAGPQPLVEPRNGVLGLGDGAEKGRQYRGVGKRGQIFNSMTRPRNSRLQEANMNFASVIADALRVVLSLSIRIAYR